MPYRRLEHTADLALEVTAADLGGLFAEALRGLAGCLTDAGGVEARIERRIELQAADLERLMVEWLGEAVYLFEVEGLVLAGARVEVEPAGGGWRLAADAAGEPFDPARHPLEAVVKGVTYHRLEVAEAPGGWRARIVFDL